MNLLVLIKPVCDCEKGSALHASALDGKAVHLLDQLPIPPWRSPLLRAGIVYQFDPQPAQIWVQSDTPVFIEYLPGSVMTISIRGNQPAVIGNGYWHYEGKSVDNPKKSTLTTWALGADGKFARLSETALDHESTFHLVGNLGIAWERVNQPRLLDVADPAAIGILGFLNFDTAMSLNYNFADGAVGKGLWIPTGPYGVEAAIFAK